MKQVELSKPRKPCKDAKHDLVQIGGPPAHGYWKTLDEKRNGPVIKGEFPGGLPSPGTNTTALATRRDFLALMGFGLAAAGLAGCRAPVQNAVPMLFGSDEIIPGVSNFYATTCRGCASSCSLLVKQRDGRPIKIDGNSKSPLFGGGTCATGQATVLSLYDEARLRGPVWHGQPATWDEIDQHVVGQLEASKTKTIALVSGTITSPSTLAILGEWKRQYPGFKHVTYDAVSFSAMREANGQFWGRKVIPHYRFDKARVIVALEADFLGAWLSPVEFVRQYSSAGKQQDRPPLHIQIESGLSVTGSNADVRLPVAPSQMELLAASLLGRIAKLAGAQDLALSSDTASDTGKLDAIAQELWKHRGEALVVSGINQVQVQVIVNAMNLLLGNIGKTIDLDHPSLQRTGDDLAIHNLIDEMENGAVEMVIFYGANPGYDYAEPEHFLSALARVPFSISLSDRLDETSSHVHAVCPDHHFLEAWGDAEPVDSHFSLAQPLIAPLFETRAAQDSLLKWLGRLPETGYYSYLRKFWRTSMFPTQTRLRDFDAFWEQSLRDGVFVLASSSVPRSPDTHGDWRSSVRTILKKSQQQHAPTADEYELHFYESVALRDGRHANNPWLQELPDPISKLTWGNYAAVSSKLAEKLVLSDGDVVRLKAGNHIVELPTVVQPGQEPRTISIALGYGRTRVGKAGDNVGLNIYPLTQFADGNRQYSVAQVTLERTGRHEKLAGTQADFSMEGRPIALETSFDELTQPSSEPQEQLPDLWAPRLQGEHNWGMAIDINACTGCSACVVACQAENNVPVVGKSEVARSRIMHWIRIDRYHSGSEENPLTVHQPMMCQHCQHAPCETVCPVLATTTSSEGLNQQVYNRCIGTRYCANNCPYKVRRFNWFQYAQNPEYDYTMENDLARMVLNPDVAVRSRGVMEKCSLCVQRIQLAKNLALQGKRELAEGDIQTACQQACPAEAIVFGDLKDPHSRVSQLQRDRRSFQVLPELGVRPNIAYLKKVRNSLKA